MPDNISSRVMQAVTVGLVLGGLYLFFKYKNAGTHANIPGPSNGPIPPNIPKCSVAFVSDNPSIPLAADYLNCIFCYAPATSKLGTRPAQNYGHIPTPNAKCAGSTTPFGIAQLAYPCTASPVKSCCNPGYCCVKNLPCATCKTSVSCAMSCC